MVNISSFLGVLFEIYQELSTWLLVLVDDTQLFTIAIKSQPAFG